MKTTFKKTAPQVKKSITKKDIKIKHHSGLYFQVGLIVSLFVMLYIVNTKFEIKQYAHEPLPPPIEDTYFIGDVTIVKEPIEVEKPKKEKKVKANHTTVVKDPKPEDKNKETAKEPTDTESSNTPKEGKSEEPTTETPIKDEDNSPSNVMIVEKVPVFPGCESLSSNQEKVECMNEKMRNIIQRKFNPYLAEELGLKGTNVIQVAFVINKKGEIDNLHIRAPKKALKNETERVLGYFPKMSPGIQNGKNVDVMYSLPIVIKVE